MFTLTQQEVEMLLKSTDPAVVAATKKLIEAEEKGEFIPKSRFSQELEERKSLAKKLADIEAGQKTAEEERAKKAGEFEKLLESEKAAHQKTQVELDAEKKDAEEYRKSRKLAIEAVRKLMGDKWDDSFQDLPLEALSKIAGQQIPILGVVTTSGKPPDQGDFYTLEQIKALPQSEMTGKVLEKVNASLAHLNK